LLYAGKPGTLRFIAIKIYQSCISKCLAISAPRWAVIRNTAIDITSFVTWWPLSFAIDMVWLVHNASHPFVFHQPMGVSILGGKVPWDLNLKSHSFFQTPALHLFGLVCSYLISAPKIPSVNCQIHTQAETLNPNAAYINSDGQSRRCGFDFAFDVELMLVAMLGRWPSKAPTSTLATSPSIKFLLVILNYYIIGRKINKNSCYGSSRLC